MLLYELGAQLAQCLEVGGLATLITGDRHLLERSARWLPIPFIAPRAGTYHISFTTTVKCPSGSSFSAVRVVRYITGGSLVKVAQTRHSEIDSGDDWRPHAMSAIVTLALNERIGVKIFSQSNGGSGGSQINQDGTLTALVVHNVD